MAATYGFLLDYDWCTGCHSCEVACQVEHGFVDDVCGLKVFEVGPWEHDKNGSLVWQYDYTVAFTDACDHCADRLKLGKLPTCVQTCQAQCLKYGKIADLKEELGEHRKQSLIVQ